MTENLKLIYSGKEHTTPAILDGKDFDPIQIPALLKTFVLNHWNNQQVNEDGKIDANDITIIDHAYQKAEPNKYVLTIHWKFL